MSAARAVVLLSGGLDSAVALKWAIDHHQVALALTFDYGQRSALREMKAAQAMARRYGIEHQLLALDWLAEATHTALVDTAQELPHPGDLEDPRGGMRNAAAVWVPNRNGLFVNIAASLAEARGLDLIVAGFNAEEAATFPDNSPQFVEAVNHALEWSTLRHPRLTSPTQELTKAGIVRLGREIDAPLDLVWACYEGGESYCWQCESCRRLQRALRDTGNLEWFCGANPRASGGH